MKKAKDLYEKYSSLMDLLKQPASKHSEEPAVKAGPVPVTMEGVNRLDALIAQLCPNGVEYKKLGDIGTFTRGNGLQKKDFVDTGVGCIHYGQIYTFYNLCAYETKTFVNEELAQSLKKVEKGDLVIACTSENIEDVCKSVVWLGDNTIVTGGHSAIFKHNQNPKYVAYFFQSSYFFEQKRKLAVGTKVIEIYPAKLNEVIIPVPPLPVQEEIVRILDTFAELTAELTAELAVELAKRKQQYQYYITSLIENSSNRMLSLDDVCSLITDGSHYSPQSSKDGYYMPSVKDMKTNCFDYSNCKIISKNDYDILHKQGCSPRINDVLISKDGATMLKYVFVFKDNTPIVVLSSIAIFRTNQNIIIPKYLVYCFRQNDFVERTVRDYSTVGGVPRIILKNFKKIKIPVPLLSEQQRIVDILDRFDTLCNDITSGIPAEIEARKKQYEYYRDKLLSFKEAGK